MPQALKANNRLFIRTTLRLRRGVLVCLSILVCLNVVAWVVVKSALADSNLEVVFFDIGQGDSIFIETPEGNQILVDGGPDSTILEKLGQELPFWDRYIDLIVLTHPEHDHIHGLIEVIKRYKIGGILTNGVVRETAEYREWIRIIKKEEIPIYLVKAGEVIDLGDDIKLFILHPFESLSGQKIKKANNTSIVAQLVFKDFELLLTGDIEKKIEKALVNSKINLQSDILKVPHHGSKTSSTQDFINAVNPIVAIIQAGRENSYGHPHKSVLERLNLNNIAIFRNDQDGDIKILTDGINFQVK